LLAGFQRVFEKVCHGGSSPWPLAFLSAGRLSAPARDDYLKLLERVRPPKFSQEAIPDLITALATDEGQVVATIASDLAAFGEAQRSRSRTSAHSSALALVAAGAIRTLHDLAAHGNEHTRLIATTCLKDLTVAN
jgi:hypothetical protein